jgi:hypothetical protein
VAIARIRFVSRSPASGADKEDLAGFKVAGKQQVLCHTRFAPSG